MARGQTSGFVALGTPIKTPEFVVACARERLDQEQGLLDELPQLPDLQSAWLLLLFCAASLVSCALPAPRRLGRRGLTLLALLQRHRRDAAERNVQELPVDSWMTRPPRLACVRRQRPATCSGSARRGSNSLHRQHLDTKSRKRFALDLFLVFFPQGSSGQHRPRTLEG